MTADDFQNDHSYQVILIRCHDDGFFRIPDVITQNLFSQFHRELLKIPVYIFGRIFNMESQIPVHSGYSGKVCFFCITEVHGELLSKQI
jgi:hypothetical protein